MQEVRRRGTTCSQRRARQTGHIHITTIIMAAQMFGEIYSESLQELLASIYQEKEQVGISTDGDPGLKNNSYEFLGLHRDDVLEIQGPAATGKTALLYHLIVDYMLSISPNHGSCEQIKAAVQYKGVVLFDTDNCFDLVHLRRVLSSRLARLLPHFPSDATEIHDLCQICLEGLHVFFPTSSSQLAIALNHLLKYHAQNMPDREIGLVAIDSISSFFWPDRFVAEQVRSMSKSKPSLGPGSSLLHVFNQLQHVRTSLHPLVVYTNWGLNPVMQSNDTVEYKQHLPHHPSFNTPPMPANQSTRNDRYPDTIMLPLTHHITFFTPLPGRTLTKDTPRVGENAVAVSTGVLRYADGSQTKQFNLFVNEDGVVFEN